ncbi:MAG: signal peptide peptidase SppA [Armatimonadetes bacterium]|nr:signal peptide peptidase SppA [Candidatus Hippobium faecium]
MEQDNFEDIEINLGEPQTPNINVPPKTEQKEHNCCREKGKSNNKCSFVNSPFGCLAGGFAGCVVIPLIVFIIICISLGVAFKSDGKRAVKSNEDYIAVVHVEGIMTTGSVDAGIFGASGISGSDTVSKLIREAADDTKAKGIILRVNSPGGTPVAAEEIGEAIKYAKSKKPVWTSMADNACSAAYWISSCTDKIYANSTTMTGSIGVIMNGMDYSRLLDKLGVSSQTVKSGKYKDIGSGSRPMTEEEKALLQNMIDDTYDVFLDTVAEGRKLSKETVKSLADGRVYTGRQAVDKKLADKIGTFNACADDLAKETGMKKTVVRNMTGKGFWDQIMAPDMKNMLNIFLLEELKNAAGTQLELR